MATKVFLPQLAPAAVEATIVKWLKREGDQVGQNEELVEVMVDKVTIVMEAPETGVLIKIVAPTGTVVPTNSTLGWIGVPDESIATDGPSRPMASGSRSEGAGRESYVPASPAAKKLAHEHGIDLTRISGSGLAGMVLLKDVQHFMETQRRPRPADRAPRVTPLARGLSRELGVDLASVRGSGCGGRITTDDVLSAVERTGASPQPALAEPATAGGASQDSVAALSVTSIVPLVGLRRTIAQRMAQSSQAVARVTHTTEVDMTEAVHLRQEMTSQSETAQGVKISYTDIVVKVVGYALRGNPMMNSRLVGDEIQVIGQINVGVAVAVPQGLVVPVIHDVDHKGLVAVAREVRDKVVRARAGALRQEDVTGGTFTVSNLGSYDIDTFSPIVNLPEVGILGVGRIVEKPAIFRGEFARRSMMYLSLSFDHRVVDGAPAAEFLRSVKQFLEHPRALFV